MIPTWIWILIGAVVLAVIVYFVFLKKNKAEDKAEDGKPEEFKKPVSHRPRPNREVDNEVAAPNGGLVNNDIMAFGDREFASKRDCKNQVKAWCRLKYGSGAPYRQCKKALKEAYCKAL